MVAQAVGDKVRENRLRRMAARQGLRLEKSRRRDRRALDHGVYFLMNARSGNAVEGASAGMDLDAVEAFLTG